MTAVITSIEEHRVRAYWFTQVRDAATIKDADAGILALVNDPGVDDDDLVLAMLMWEEGHQRQGIHLAGNPRFEHCYKGAESCVRCRVTSLWERAAGSCLPCYGRGVIDSCTVTGTDGRDADIDVPCPECRGTGDRR